MAWFSTNRIPFIVCLVFAVATGTDGSTLHAGSQGGRRRRRRSNPDTANDQKTATLLKAIMEEVIILRKQLRDSNEKCAKDMHELKEEVKALKGVTGLPFQVDESSKTVRLKNWNLHIEADSNSPVGVGNLVVGEGHFYNAAKNSFFAGYKHTGSGENIALVGGKENHVWGNSENAAILGGHNHRINNCETAIMVGGAGNHMEMSNYGAIMAGNGNTMNSTSFAIIAGGANNRVIHGHAEAIFAGTGNLVTRGQHSTILGGSGNKIDDSFFSAILSGSGNRVFKSPHSVVSGGSGNFLNTTSMCHVASGSANTIQVSAGASISGGRRNFIGGRDYGDDGLVAQFSSIAGGDYNSISEHFTFIGAKNGAVQRPSSAEHMTSPITKQEFEQEIEDMQEASKMAVAKSLGAEDSYDRWS